MRSEHLKRLESLTALATVWLLTAMSSVGQGNAANPQGFGTALHGVPASVTSFGFGGQPGFHGVPASVTSPNFGNLPLSVSQGSVFFPHRHRSRLRSPFLGGMVAVPYAYPVYVADPGVDDSLEMQDDYRGGPTIFDRRGPGAEDYRRPGWRTREERPAEPADYGSGQNADRPKPDKVADQVSTILVFKDGHRLEVRNYAIVGAMLFALSDGDLSNRRTRKIPVAELDLSATVKQNDDRGVDFQIPAAARMN